MSFINISKIEERIMKLKKKDEINKIKENTAKGYIGKIKFLYRNCYNLSIGDDGMFNYKIFYEIEQLKDFLNLTYPESNESKRGYIVAVMALLRAMKKDKNYKNMTTKIYREYKIYLDEVIKKVRAYKKTAEFKNNKCELTDEQIETAVNKAMEKYKNTGRLQYLQDVIIIRLYTMIIPMRADYVGTKIKDRYEEKDDTNFNYVYLKDKKIYINNHKTDGQNGG